MNHDVATVRRAGAPIGSDPARRRALRQRVRVAQEVLQRTSRRHQRLLVQDLVLLTMDDDGSVVRGAGTLYHLLGGAVLAELALLGRIRTDGAQGRPGAPRATGIEGPLLHPVLQSSHDTAIRRPWRLRPLLGAIGVDAWSAVVGQLLDRGQLEVRADRPLGVVRSARWPAGDVEHEARLRARLRRVLLGERPADARTAAQIGLLSAAGVLSAPRPSLPWTEATRARARGLERGHWGADALEGAAGRCAAAVVAASASVLVTVSLRPRTDDPAAS